MKKIITKIVNRLPWFFVGGGIGGSIKAFQEGKFALGVVSLIVFLSLLAILIIQMKADFKKASNN